MMNRLFKSMLWENDMRRILMWMVGCTMGIVGMASALDLYGQRRPSQSHYDAIIVLGCRVRPDGTPSLALQARTRKAVELYQQGYADKIVLTGGVGDYAPAESVAAMKYATTELGVESDIFVLETMSTSTEENAEFAKQALPMGESVLVVSDSYHIFRSEKVFSRYFTSVHGVGRVPIPSVRIKGALREVAALISYWYQGRL